MERSRVSQGNEESTRHDHMNTMLPVIRRTAAAGSPREAVRPQVIPRPHSKNGTEV